VNSQITDSVSQANLKVIGDAPALSMGELFVATSQALANAAHNSTLNQQQMVTTSQAANVQGVSTLYSLDIGSTGVATSDIDQGILGLDRLPPGLGSKRHPR